MHDPEQFQKETIKAINDLEDTFQQTMSRQLALGAMVRAIVSQLPLAVLPHVLEEYEGEVDHQVSQLPPKHQQPKYWEEWSTLLEARIEDLKRAHGLAKREG